MMSKKSLLDLPRITEKWPQCVIIGKRVTKEQARDIIRKTDYFFSYKYILGNDTEFVKELRTWMGMPPVWEYGLGQETFYDMNKNLEEWKRKEGILQLNHFNNDWISSSYVGGPSGWCHVNGVIGSNKNIGKWPSWEEVYDDLKTLGKEFPFLDITAYIMNCESCTGFSWEPHFKRKCLGGLHLYNGNIEVVDGIDPYDDVCKENEDYDHSWVDIPPRLKKEVEEVVTLVDIEDSYFQERCPTEHIFRIEEACEYFNL